MTSTPKNTLPYIAASQAQKHVTHNDALRMLDTLVQLTVLQDDLASPPAAPQNGDSYILPAAASGEWAGQDQAIAVYEENAWTYYTPKAGWCVWVEDLNSAQVFNGTEWVSQFATFEFQNIDQIGINTTADVTNRLAVSSDATLLTHAGSGHQMKINKAGTTDTASMLFQTAWSGRAEMGTVGGDNFSIKVSDDGSAFQDGLVIDQATGAVSFPSGVSGRIEQKNTGNSVFIGPNTGMSDDLSGNRNVFIGEDAGRSNTTGDYSVAIGRRALYYNTTGVSNVAMGKNTMLNNISGSSNSAFGAFASHNNTTGNNNTSFGTSALYANTIGSYNTALGASALRYTTTGADNEDYSNCVGLGKQSRVSGSNQVQLGDSSTTTYAFGAVQDRSDRRDKADIRDSKLGLGFLKLLRPVDYRLDMRDDYYDLIETVDEDSGEVINSKIVKIEKDGSRKRKRYHHGFIAQEVKEAIEKSGLDFGGYQDHSIGGGEDVLSLGYQELIAPMVRAIQQLSEEIDALKAKAAH